MNKEANFGVAYNVTPEEMLQAETEFGKIVENKIQTICNWSQGEGGRRVVVFYNFFDPSTMRPVSLILYGLKLYEDEEESYRLFMLIGDSFFPDGAIITIPKNSATLLDYDSNAPIEDNAFTPQTFVKNICAILFLREKSRQEAEAIQKENQMRTESIGKAITLLSDEEKGVVN